MSATMTAPKPAEGEQRLSLPGIDWRQYVTISDALGERAGLRMIYNDGRLTFLTKSRRHEWFADCLGQIVALLANASGVPLEPAGEATFRQEGRGAGVEGDRVYYLGANAQQMRGPQNIDLATQPPPDLAIEVEVSHPADEAMSVWSRLGVPEVWRFDAEDEVATFWLRREDGTYISIDRSRGLPALTPSDIAQQLKLADSLGWSPWFAQLDGWVRQVLLPRLGEGG